MAAIGTLIWSVALTAIAIVSSATACDRCLNQSTVAFFSDGRPLKAGACGYGSLAPEFYGGRVAAASSFIYKGGHGCAGCYQMRCNADKLCSKGGTTFVVTDINSDNKTGFTLSRSAFAGMANSRRSAQALLKLGLVDVEYKRVLCDYKKNLTVRVEESSQKPDYLSIQILNVGGQTEIVIVDVAQVGTSNWMSMDRKNYGALWQTSDVPSGALQFRFLATAGYDGKYHWAKNVLPENWVNGELYDTALQITDIAQQFCPTCDNSTWGSGLVH